MWWFGQPGGRAQPGERHRVGGVHHLGEQTSRPVDRLGAALVAHPGISFGVCTVSSRVRLAGFVRPGSRLRAYPMSHFMGHSFTM